MTKTRADIIRDMNGVTLSMLLGESTPKVEEIKKILEEKNCDFEYEDVTGNTCLLRALGNSKIPDWIYRALIDQGAKCDVRNRLGYPAICLAAGRKDVYAVEKMAGKGAKINDRDPHERTPLMKLIKAVCDKGVINTMVTKLKADINAQDATGYTAMMHALEAAVNPSIACENLETLYALGAKPRLTTRAGASLTDIARSTGIAQIQETVDKIMAQEQGKRSAELREEMDAAVQKAIKTSAPAESPDDIVVRPQKIKLQL